MVLGADHHRHVTLGQLDEHAVGPGQAVGVGDDGADIVERDAALLLVAGGDGQESAMHRQMQPIRADVDDPIHTPHATRNQR